MCPLHFIFQDQKKYMERLVVRWKALSLEGVQWLPTCNSGLLTGAQALGFELRSRAGGSLQFPLAFSPKLVHSVFFPSRSHFAMTGGVFGLSWFWFQSRHSDSCWHHIVKPVNNYAPPWHPSEAQGVLASSQGKLWCKMTLR